MNGSQIDEQDALTYLWGNNINNINDKYELLNITYNLNIYKIESNLAKAEKPIKVAHFHPQKPRHVELFRPILDDRFMGVLNKYGIK